MSVPTVGPSGPESNRFAVQNAAAPTVARFAAKPASRDVYFSGKSQPGNGGESGPPHMPATRKLTQKLIAGGGAVSIPLAVLFPPVGIPLAGLWGAFSALGIYDMTQKKHSLGRTHPILWRFRLVAEAVRPELQQYFVEKDTDEVPLSREQRNLVYARAKGQNDKQAWGTLHDVNKVGYEYLLHNTRPLTKHPPPIDPVGLSKVELDNAKLKDGLHVKIGGPDCKQPYVASIFNTSGMSYGSLSAQAVMALAKGAFLDNFYMNTGEGGISPFHLGFDVNTENPNFDMNKIIEMAKSPMTPEELDAAKRTGTAGVIEKGIVRLLPVSAEEQIAAIKAGEEEGIRKHLRSKIDALPQDKLKVLSDGGIDKKEAYQKGYEIYMMGKSGTMATAPLEGMSKEQFDILANVAHQVLADTIANPPVDQKTVNDEIANTTVAKMLGAKSAEEVEKKSKTLRARVLKKFAKKLRANTMNYTRFPSGDIVWNIGTGYFGCRNADGTFSEKEFEKRAKLPQVKMIELKMSQGAKPGGGGILPKDKLTNGLAKMRGVPEGTDCISPAAHSAFSNPVEMMQFIKKLRDLSGGKPVGFKLCVGQPYQFIAICKAMKETGIYPDFITVDGAEGGTGAAPAPFTNDVGLPLNAGLAVVHNTLVGMGIRNNIKIIAAGKIVDEADMVSKMARGADVCNSARAMMLSIGCIMARICHTNRCPVGVATQDPDLTLGLDPDDKGLRNASYHRETVKGMRHLLDAQGLESAREITPDNVMIKTGPEEAKRLSDVLMFLKKGQLEQGQAPEDMNGFNMKQEWEAADPGSFAPRPGSMLEKRIEESLESKLSDEELAALNAPEAEPVAPAAPGQELIQTQQPPAQNVQPQTQESAPQAPADQPAEEPAAEKSKSNQAGTYEEAAGQPQGTVVLPFPKVRRKEEPGTTPPEDDQSKDAKKEN